MIYIYFKEILNSNFNRTGIVKEKKEFMLAIFLKNELIKHKHQVK